MTRAKQRDEEESEWEQIAGRRRRRSRFSWEWEWECAIARRSLIEFTNTLTEREREYITYDYVHEILLRGGNGA